MQSFRYILRLFHVLIQGGTPVFAAFYDSSKSKFHIDGTGGGTLRDISAFVTEVTGLPGSRTLAEVTAINDAGSKFHPSIETVTVGLRGVYDDSVESSGGPEVIFGVLRTATATASIAYRPEGNTSGMQSYTAEVWVENFEIVSRVGSHVEWSATLRVDGQVTRTTV